MLRYSFVLALGLTLTGTASASTWADSLFDDLSRDFGTVPKGSVLTYPFRIVNKTNGPIHIAGIRVSCGCTTARALQNDLAPGQETVILAQMDTSRFSNSKAVTIYVTFDRPHFDEVRLWVQANSRDDISVLPDTFAFGRIKRGTGPSATVTMTFLGNPNWQITGVACDSNYIKAEAQLLKREGGEVVYKISATLRADAPAGKWFTDVWVQTNNPASPRIRVPLTVEIEAALTVSPSAVGLGEVKAGKVAERKVVVRGVRPFRIVGVQGTDKELTVRDSTDESKMVHVLTVSVQSQRAGPMVRTLRVLTDLAGEDPVELQAQAMVVP
jgi:hypothetical protein